MDKALKCSQKSLELQPDEGAYLDTLAHVYFGKGDFANAVKYQAKAVEARPPYAADPPRARALPQETRGEEEVDCRRRLQSPIVMETP